MNYTKIQQNPGKWFCSLLRSWQRIWIRLACHEPSRSDAANRAGLPSTCLGDAQRCAVYQNQSLHGVACLWDSWFAVLICWKRKKNVEHSRSLQCWSQHRLRHLSAFPLPDKKIMFLPWERLSKRVFLKKSRLDIHLRSKNLDTLYLHICTHHMYTSYTCTPAHLTLLYPILVLALSRISL